MEGSYLSDISDQKSQKVQNDSLPTINYDFSQSTKILLINR